jgi:hypothetical protein
MLSISDEMRDGTEMAAVWSEGSVGSAEYGITNNGVTNPKNSIYMWRFALLAGLCSDGTAEAGRVSGDRDLPVSNASVSCRIRSQEGGASWAKEDDFPLDETVVLVQPTVIAD